MSFQDRIQKYVADLDKEASKYPVLNHFERSSGLPKVYLIGGLTTIYFFFLFLNYGGQLLCNLVAFGFPAYQSIIAIESTGTRDDTQWLIYWTVFGFFSVLEYWSNTLLYWIPMYWLLKVVFCLWLALPQFSGALYLYNIAIKPLAQKYIVTTPSPASTSTRAKATPHSHAI